MIRLALILSLLFSLGAQAQHFELEMILFSPSTISKIIGDYPAQGSELEKRDFEILLDYQAKRTKHDCDLAKKDESLTVKQMFSGILTPYEVKLMTVFMAKAYASVGANAHLAKRIYSRPRPYESNSKIKPCIDLEESYAYPSGHTMATRLYARILSEVYPERAEKFLARADKYAENRIIGGVHHPSDVEAGKKLADALAKEMIETDDFISELVSLK